MDLHRVLDRPFVRKHSTKLIHFLFFYIEPIEQNVYATGSKGVYELTLIEKVSRNLDRFLHDAKKFDRITAGKTTPEIEKLFWKSLFNNAPLYGADVAGTLFDKQIPWNLSELSTVLN